MLSVEFCGLKLENPTVLASGILGTSAELLKRVAKSGAGALTPKSIGYSPRAGHKNPAVVALSKDTIVNAVGLPTPGYRNMDDELKKYSEIPVPIICSIYGSSPEEYAEIAKYVQKFKIDMIELNISCPHRGDGILFGADPVKTREVIKAVKQVAKLPIMPKLTPNCKNIIEIAISAQDAGADALCALNTFGPKPFPVNSLNASVPGFGKGGISGPSIFEETLDIISDIYDVVKIPILGMGGVMTGSDAMRMMKAGASAVGVGSAVHYRGIDVFAKICRELKEIMSEQNILRLESVVGENSK